MAPEPIVVRPRKPLGQPVIAERVVEDELQRPRCGEAHQRLDHHRGEHDDQPTAIGPDQLADERQHRALHRRHCRGRGGMRPSTGIRRSGLVVHDSSGETSKR
jgi:hypothetical protein